MIISNKQRRELAERLWRQGETWRAYFGSYTIMNMRDHIFTDSVLDAFGFGPDDMEMSVYKAFYKMADLVDLPTTTRHGKFRVKFGRKTPCCKACGYSIGGMRWNYCPKCGTVIADD